MMQRILLIGATTSLGQVTRNYLLKNSTDEITILDSHATRLVTDDGRETVINGDPTKLDVLVSALQQQDVVLVTLNDNVPSLAANLVAAMQSRQLKRLVLVSSMGIYNEIPAHLGPGTNLKQNRRLQPFRQTADIIENSALDYTIVRPAGLDDGLGDYEVTLKGEPFAGRCVARLAVADVILTAIDTAAYQRESVGVDRPD
ncbi:NAD(P)H-binding protein [Lactiplantibacillus fabifermentans]|nr:NAD(P)H-binding protein [Lactiplantibacillus fabifermentans]